MLGKFFFKRNRPTLCSFYEIESYHLTVRYLVKEITEKKYILHHP